MTDFDLRVISYIASFVAWWNRRKEKRAKRKKRGRKK